MTSRPRHRLRCPYCGSPYTPTPTRDCCRTCERISREANYNPSWDPDFPGRYATMLVERAGHADPDERWLRPFDVPCTPHDAFWARSVVRRHGFVLETDAHKGTRLVSISFAKCRGEH